MKKIALLAVLALLATTAIVTYSEPALAFRPPPPPTTCPDGGPPPATTANNLDEACGKGGPFHLMLLDWQLRLAPSILIFR